MQRPATSGLRPAAVVILVAAGLSMAMPAQAQRDYEPLFDKFNLRLEGSWLALGTEIRLDSETLGRGTTLNFEDDLGLSKGEAVPTLAFEWQIARKHRLAVRFQDIGRDSSAQALTEIRWGDEIIPVDADITLAFDSTQYFVDYTYFPWVRERWGAGFGFGLRMMDVFAELRWEEEAVGSGGDDIDGIAPLPYFYFEYRRLLAERWRLMAGLGWLHVEIGDIEGGQWIGRATMEYMIGKRWAVGGGINLATIDIDWVGIEDEEGDPELTGAMDADINDFSIFVRFRI